MQSIPRTKPLLFLPGALALAVVAAGPTLAQAQDHPSLQHFENEQARIGRELGDIASGLEEALKTDDVDAATRLHAVERATIDLVGAAEYVKWRTRPDKGQAQAGLRATLARIYQLQERVQQHAIDTLEEIRPGEPERQHFARDGHDLYRPLYRLGTPQPGEPGRTPAQALKEMEDAHAAKGGKASDFAYLTRRSLGRMMSGQLTEWVQFGADRIRFNTTGAKHPVIAMGKSPRGAGSMKVYKNDAGEVILAIVSNSSGNFKPGPGSTEGPVQALIDLDVDPAVILVTSIIPEEPELVKLLLKARFLRENPQMKDADVKAHLKEPMARVVAAATPPPRPATLKPPTTRFVRLVAPLRQVATALKTHNYPVITRKLLPRVLSPRH